MRGMKGCNVKINVFSVDPTNEPPGISINLGEVPKRKLKLLAPTISIVLAFRDSYLSTIAALRSS